MTALQATFGPLADIRGIGAARVFFEPKRSHAPGAPRAITLSADQVRGAIVDTVLHSVLAQRTPDDALAAMRKYSRRFEQLFAAYLSLLVAEGDPRVGDPLAMTVVPGVFCGDDDICPDRESIAFQHALELSIQVTLSLERKLMACSASTDVTRWLELHNCNTALCVGVVTSISLHMGEVHGSKAKRTMLVAAIQAAEEALLVECTRVGLFESVSLSTDLPAASAPSQEDFELAEAGLAEYVRALDAE